MDVWESKCSGSFLNLTHWIHVWFLLPTFTIKLNQMSDWLMAQRIRAATIVTPRPAEIRAATLGAITPALPPARAAEAPHTKASMTCLANARIAPSFWHPGNRRMLWCTREGRGHTITLARHFLVLSHKSDGHLVHTGRGKCSCPYTPAPWLGSPLSRVVPLPKWPFYGLYTRVIPTTYYIEHWVSHETYSFNDANR